MSLFNKNTPEEPTPQPDKSKNPDGSLNFNRYFLAERRMALENVSFETAQQPKPGQVLKLGVKDTVVAQVRYPVGVKVNFNRRLQFEPDGPFTLSVTYGVNLVFNPGTRDEIDWKSVDMASEFQKNCPQIIGNIKAKINLLVAEITNAATGTPMLPPN